MIYLRAVGYDFDAEKIDHKPFSKVNEAGVTETEYRPVITHYRAARCGRSQPLA
jgi:hypothetical protein